MAPEKSHPEDTDTLRTSVAVLGNRVSEVEKDMVEIKNSLAAASVQQSTANARIYDRIQQTNEKVNQVAADLHMFRGIVLFVGPAVTAIITATVTSLVGFAVYKIFGG